MTPDPHPAPTSKSALRLQMRERRAAASAKNPQAAFALRDVFLGTIKLPADAIVAGYVAWQSEIDPAPLLEALHQRGHRLCLPIAGPANAPLRFRAYAPGDALDSPGTPPISEPHSTAALVEPDIILVPLLAFDPHGHRLGQGAGHYDRTLTALRERRTIVAIGLGFDGQKVAAIPARPHDAQLDKIVTETQAHTILGLP